MTLRLPTGYLPGRRLIVGVPVANPLAGADPTITVPAGRFWRVATFTGKLATSGTAGNRLPVLTITTDGTTVYAKAAPVVVAASGAAWYTWAVQGGDNDLALTGGTIYATSRLPDLLLPPGAALVLTTDQLAAGDQWSSIGLYVQDHWVTNPPGDSAVDYDRLEEARELLG
jgi:hypothetical protein